MQKRHPIAIPSVAVLLFLLTAIGSAWDLEIAGAVYMGETPAKNIFGILFSYIGVLPTFVGWSFLGAGIFCLAKRQTEDRKKRRWLIALAVLLFVLSFFYYCNTLYLANANAFRPPFAVAYGIGIAVILAAAYLGYALAKGSEDGRLLGKLLFLVAVSLVTLLFISITKELMCRPRYRFVLATENTDYFRGWWQSGRTIKESLGAAVVTDEFASLPSGHSAYSMFAVFLLPALADHVRGLKGRKPLLFALGLVFWALTALSRMSVGAHYLTDVTVGGLAALLAYGLVSLVRRHCIRKHTGGI